MKQLQISLNSQRLSLQSLQSTDAEFILALLNSEGWLKFIGDRNVHSIADAEAYIQKINANPDILYWVVRLNHQTTSIGIISLLKRKDLLHPDFGFAFLPSYQSKGYAYESCVCVLQHCLTGKDVSFLNAITSEDNTTSIHLLKKLGFTQSGEQMINKKPVNVYGASSDRILISLVIHSFFSAFSNTNGHHPDLPVLKEICLPHILIISKQSEKTEIMNLVSFLQPREQLLTEGTLKEFSEKEIQEETTIIKEIAQRHSHYKKTGILKGTPFETYGHKLFQLVKLEGAWKISSVTWTDV